ncbi:MAG: nucleotidyl transferase AbiEii/AbiGii toxin family protein [Bacteroidetes bacterium]|nr:nucleotidyl transferase AbiEii/AbiGii toxin family protein [Bacteroidota bacterium]MBL0080188.1 nucleotidyl transferase AbiEii/AbiGii toxin family protein [Bacteroidota bacterium]MBL0287326.1 nucleotidyl transferase AbiEii/AbiGii toxin family protein [Bacteroidota bacterium]
MKSAASIRAKLLNISREEKITFQQILFRFFHERFLARLSVSPYKNSLLLKGGNFIYALQGNTTRPTIDIDFLGHQISNESHFLLGIIQEICRIHIDDHVSFNPDTIETFPITENKTYHGTRLKVETTFDTIKQHIQIDIGFGDVITPSPIIIKYPVILDEFSEPILKAYNSETAIAEKLHAMVMLANFNSRMKDFYDVYKLIENNDFNRILLKDAIQATFKKRESDFDLANCIIIIETIARDTEKLKLWYLFLKKINSDQIDFKMLIQSIKIVLISTFKKND